MTFALDPNAGYKLDCARYGFCCTAPGVPPVTRLEEDCVYRAVTFARLKSVDSVQVLTLFAGHHWCRFPVGGDVVPAELQRRFQETVGVTILEGCGMTELPPMYTYRDKGVR